MISVSVPNEGDKKGGGKRGEIEVFSRASRYRLFRQLHQIEFKTVSFVTLTYPAQFPTEPRVYKGNLKEWRRRFEILYGKVKAIWRLEFQERGAPHFHIMYLDCPFIPIWDLGYLWKSVCHTYDLAHEINGVDLKLITDNSQQALIAFYLGKYIAKVDERGEQHAKENVGRWWGRWNITDQTPSEFEVTDWEAVRIVDFLLGCRLGTSVWEPIDKSICSIFGGSMGGSEFGQLARGYENYLKCGSFREPD